MSTSPFIHPKDRFMGALVGLAAGDAVGTTVEFQPRGSFHPVTDMSGGGPFSLQPGQWTDDTSMALCLALSLIEKQRFDPVDQLAKYLRWYKEGYMSSTGSCFDIGNTCRAALSRFERDGSEWCGSTNPHSAVVACWFASQGLSPEASLSRVAQLWTLMTPQKQARHTGSPECACQLEFVRNWISS